MWDRIDVSIPRNLVTAETLPVVLDKMNEILKNSNRHNGVPTVNPFRKLFNKVCCKTEEDESGDVVDKTEFADLSDLEPDSVEFCTKRYQTICEVVDAIEVLFNRVSLPEFQAIYDYGQFPNFCKELRDVHSYYSDLKAEAFHDLTNAKGGRKI